VSAWSRSPALLALPALLLVLLVGLAIIRQQPLTYDIAIGQEDGWGADLPFVENWNTTEASETVRYRWTRDDSRVSVRGLPPYPMAVEITFLPATAHPRATDGVTVIKTGISRDIVVPLSLGQRTVHMLVPQESFVGDWLYFDLKPPTWTPADDPRTLGVPVDHISLRSLADAQPRTLFYDGFWSPLFIWPTVVVLAAWTPLLRAGATFRQLMALSAMLVALLLAAYVVDRPRSALAAQPFVTGLIWSSILTLPLRWALGKLNTKLSIGASASLLDFLVLLFWASFTLRYVGRLYPLSMPGDLGFHNNRIHDVLRGLIPIVSRHRGIDFPYPPALYLMLLPFRLLPIETPQLVEFTNALFGPLGIFPIAYLALRATGDERTARFTGLVYALLAPAMMSLWWSFQPHIFAQELAVWLLAGIAWGWQGLRTRRGVVLMTAGFALLFASHFGFYLNFSLLVGALLVFFVLTHRRAWVRDQRASFLGLFGAFALAQMFVLVLFYSNYTALIMDKLLAFAQGGMGAVQGGRQEATQADLWRTLWRDGLQYHYATIGVPLALLGGYWLWGRRTHSMVPLLWGATLAVAVVQGAVPFITSSTITTRWLSFAAWLVALGVGVVLNALWQRGRAGRWLAVAAIFWIGWATLMLWTGAMGYRIRPPEPF
jgi:hypothetical protein